MTDYDALHLASGAATPIPERSAATSEEREAEAMRRRIERLVANFLREPER